VPVPEALAVKRAMVDDVLEVDKASILAAMQTRLSGSGPRGRAGQRRRPCRPARRHRLVLRTVDLDHPLRQQRHGRAGMRVADPAGGASDLPLPRHLAHKGRASAREHGVRPGER
jgi:hypothetical protein